MTIKEGHGGIKVKVNYYISLEKAIETILDPLNLQTLILSLDPYQRRKLKKHLIVSIQEVCSMKEVHQ